MSEDLSKQKELEKKGFRRFLVIWFGELFSTIGTGLTAFALGVYAFKLTGKATSATMITLLTFLPAFVLRPIGGVLADRVDRRLLMVIGNLGSAAGIGLVFFFMSSDARELWFIYPGVAVSSIFFAFQNPAYKASVSDFLPKELYAKASGLIQLSGSAQFLLAPLIAGFLVSILDITYILLIDIITFLLSALAIILVRRTMKSPQAGEKERGEGNFLKEMGEGLKTIINDKGIFVLISITSLILFYVGLLQALFGPMVLSFTDERTLGTSQSVCAIGMLISSLVIGAFGSKRKHAMVLSFSLAFMGIFFAFIGMIPNIWVIIVPGFLFFFTIPFVNSSIEVLIRQNISNEKQGRVWSLISVITYFGALVAYALAGFLADHVFNPLFMPDGALVGSLGKLFGVGPGRGIALIFFISGILVFLISFLIFKSKSIRKLDLPANINPELAPE